MKKLLDSITLQGFQSHQDTSLRFVPGLNIITGASDSGKTAIIRALRWVLYNEPTGDAFINDKIGQADVQLNLNGHTITRTRNKDLNGYLLDGQLFKGFGTQIPLEIIQAHGMPKATVGDQELSLNISFQLDAPFLLSETAGAAARLLGKLAGTEEIDAAIKDVNSDLLATRRQKTTAELEIKRKETSLEDYANLDSLCNKAAEAKTLYDTVEQLQLMRNKLADLQAEYCTVLFNASELTSKIYHLGGLSEQLYEQTERLKDISKNSKHLTCIRQDYTSVKYELYKAGTILLGLSGLSQCIDITKELQSLQGKFERQKAIQQDYITTKYGIAKMRLILEKVSGLDSCIQITDTLEVLQNKAKKLKNFAVEHMINISNINRLTDQLNILVSLKSLENHLKLLEASNKALSEKKKEALEVHTLAVNIQTNQSLINLEHRKLQTAQETENKNREAYAAFLQTLGLCPFCGAELDANKIAKGA